MGRSKFLSRGTAVLATIALGLVGLGAFGGAATADPVNSKDLVNIDASKKGSISVHKYSSEAEASDAARTGTEADKANVPPGAKALNEVTFKLEKLNYDITTSDGFKTAAKATVATAAKDANFTALTQQTAGEGLATFNDLAVGAYLLTETVTPVGHIPAEPSIVFVPMTKPDGTGWNYDIHVYPKNKKTTDNPVKTDVTPTDKIITVGQYISYQITKTLPKAAEDPNTNFSKFVFVDDLSTHKYLELDAAKLNLKLMVGDVEYKVNDDYTFDTTGGKLTVTLTKTGLAKMTQAKRAAVAADVTATLTFDAKVKALPPFDSAEDKGMIVNTASTITNNGTTSTDVTQNTDPSSGGKTQFGNIKIKKVNANGEALAKAEFQLYECAADGTATGGPIKAGAQGTEDTFTTATGTGEATITGVRAGDNLKLCLVEKKAPEGYQLLPKPAQVDFTPDIVKAADDLTVVAQVKNEVDDGSIFGKLPLTGGAGVALIIILGGAVLGGAVYSARRAAKRS